MADDEVFVYMGQRGESVPRDVIRVLVDPSVTSILTRAFEGRKRLAEVELCDGFVEIGERSFGWCDHSITKIHIPTSLRMICDIAFVSSIRTPICLHDGIESIGEYAFRGCIFTNFRVPPLITVSPNTCYSTAIQFYLSSFLKMQRELKILRLNFVTAYEMWPFLPTLSSMIISLF
jgi:hypothetical protein